MTGFDENGKNQKKSSATNRRDARLAAALRENLRRRKAQERARGANERGRGEEERGREAQADPGDEPGVAPPPPNRENR